MKEIIGQKVILIIEDTEAVANLYIEVLRFICRPEWASTLHKGLERLEREPQVDLIILDLLLPDAKGLSVLQTIQTQFNHIPIVVISGGDFSIKDVITLGAQEFLEKPIQKKDLLEAMVRAISRHQVRRIFEPIDEALHNVKMELNKQKEHFDDVFQLTGY